jgi:hypothetical protein
MSAQTEIRDRILGDLKDDKILQNVTLERLWYYFELIGDITGGGGSGFTYGAGEPSGGADGDYYIRTDATQIWYNNGGTWEVTLSLTPLQITGDQFAALIATPADIIQGQVYRVVPDGGDAFALPLSIGDMYITGGNGVFLAGALANVTLTGRYEFVTYYTSDNTVFQNSISTLTVDLAQAYFSGSDIQNSSVIVNTDYVIISGITPVLPAGISRVKGKAVLDPSGNVVWDANDCQAWVTALSRYVPCTYDVGTNKINVLLEVVFRVTQTADNGPTLEVMKNDLTGVTFTAGYGDPGKYNIIPSISLSTLGTGPFNEVYVHMTGTQVIGEDVVNPFGLVSGFYDELNDTMRLGSQVVDFETNALVPTDGIFNGIPIYLICILSN